MNTKAPMSNWLTFKTLGSENDCKAALKKMPDFYRCVSSDDPALKKTTPAAAKKK